MAGLVLVEDGLDEVFGGARGTSEVLGEVALLSVAHVGTRLAEGGGQVVDAVAAE